MLRGPLGRFAPPKSRARSVAGPAPVGKCRAVPWTCACSRGGYATPSGTKRDVTPPSALIPNHDRPISPTAFLEFDV